MIKHIVVWRLKESAHGNDRATNARLIKEKNDRPTNARLIKEKLESLKGKIPGLLTIEVGIDFAHTESSDDIVLYSEFVSRAALDEYQSHPEHKAIMPFILEARQERRMVDYEV